MNPTYQPQRFKQVFVALLVIISFVGGVVAVTPAAQDWLLRWGQILSGAGSLILSGLLVFLYRQQMSLIAAEQRPFVEVEDDEADGDHLHVYLSNVGKGIATNLELVTMTVFPETENSEPGIARTRLTRQPTEAEEHRRGQSLRPAEDRIPFEARPTLGIQIPSAHSRVDPTVVERSGGTISRFGFGAGLAHLDREEAEVIRLHFYIRYTDTHEQQHIQYFRGLELDGDVGNISVDEAYRQGGKMLSGGPDVSASNLEFDLSTAETSEERTVV
jgi:hypothetical protein